MKIQKEKTQTHDYWLLPLARSSKRSAGFTVTHAEKPTEEKYSRAVEAGP